MQFLSLIRNDIKSRFAGSKLGFFWAFFSPAVTIGIYWFVYRVALQGQDMGGIPYEPMPSQWRNRAKAVLEAREKYLLQI